MVGVLFGLSHALKRFKEGGIFHILGIVPLTICKRMCSSDPLREK